MYPKNIAAEIPAAPDALTKLTAIEHPDRINVSRTPPLHPANWVVDWIFAQEKNSESMHSYLDFLRRARTQFNAVTEQMGYWNPAASHSLGHDRWSVGWAGPSLLSLASYLYILKSYEVPGCVLECGVFKGSSTACLSWVCRELGLTLYAADSFAGLPAAEGHYGPGDFQGSLAEARSNVAEHGCPECVQFIPGWFADSLKGFEHPIALLWVDVDLQQSAFDVMQNVYSRLDPNGVIFSDGFTDGVDFEGEQIRPVGGEPAGFCKFFESRKIDYKAVPGGSKGLALILPGCQPDERVLFDASSFQYLLSRL